MEGSGPNLGPKTDPKTAQNRPGFYRKTDRAAQEAAKRAPRRPKRAPRRPKRAPRSPRGNFSTILSPTWPRFRGAFGLHLGPFGAPSWPAKCAAGDLKSASWAPLRLQIGNFKTITKTKMWKTVASPVVARTPLVVFVCSSLARGTFRHVDFDVVLGTAPKSILDDSGPTLSPQPEIQTGPVYSGIQTGMEECDGGGMECNKNMKHTHTHLWGVFHNCQNNVIPSGL